MVRGLYKGRSDNKQACREEYTENENNENNKIDSTLVNEIRGLTITITEMTKIKLFEIGKKKRNNNKSDA